MQHIFASDMTAEIAHGLPAVRGHIDRGRKQPDIIGIERYQMGVHRRAVGRMTGRAGGPEKRNMLLMAPEALIIKDAPPVVTCITELVGAR